MRLALRFRWGIEKSIANEMSKSNEDFFFLGGSVLPFGSALGITRVGLLGDT